MQDNFTHQQATIMHTLNQFQHIKLTVLNLKEQTQSHMQEMKGELEQYHIQAGKLNHFHRNTEDQDRALEIAKIEAFDIWLSKEATSSDQITAQHLFERVTTKIGHMFKSLQTELRHTRLERDELQEKLEHQEECCYVNWEDLIGHNNIEDPVNMI